MTLFLSSSAVVELFSSIFTSLCLISSYQLQLLTMTFRISTRPGDTEIIHTHFQNSLLNRSAFTSVADICPDALGVHFDNHGSYSTAGWCGS